MLSLSKLRNFYIFSSATDMRISFDRLSSFVESELSKDVRSSESLFVFFNKPRDKVKILYWDKDGYALWYKRLERGKFKVPLSSECTALIKEELLLVLSGMELERVKFRRS